MTSSDSSDFETGVAQQIIQRKSPTSKKKPQPTAIAVEDHGRNEGGDLARQAYEPPQGARMVDHTVDAGPFEWETIENDDDVEIWLIRAPDTIKSKHLQGLEIDQPSSPRTARIGGFSKKNASYDIWSVGDDDAEAVGGEELRGLSCLLPRKSKDGKLCIAPKRVSHHIVISAQSSIATPPEHQRIINQDPPRRSYPRNVLKHAFVPYGARSEQSLLANLSADIEPSDVAYSSNDQVQKTKPESKGKKRKNDGELLKPPKKHKMSA